MSKQIRKFQNEKKMFRPLYKFENSKCDPRTAQRIIGDHVICGHILSGFWAIIKLLNLCCNQ